MIYMSIFNSHICSQCNNRFPFFIRPSLMINRGLLAPYLKCPECGQVCRQKIDFIRAIWIWPLTICFFIAVIYFLDAFLYNEVLLYSVTVVLYIVTVVVALFFVFVGFRMGLKLIRVENPNTRQNKFHKWFIPAGCFILFSLLFGYYTHDWFGVAIGIIIAFIVCVYLYCFSGKEGDIHKITNNSKEDEK